MTTTLSEGVKVPDVGSVNWAGDLEVNWNLLNGALANLSGNVKLDRDNTWTGEQSFTLPIVGSITGTASKAIADEDGTSIKTGYVNVAGNQTVTGDKSFTGSNTFNNILPNATNTYSLGSSSYQWSSVYAQTYYYNGTAWGLDKANVWTNTNTFTRSVFSNSGFWIVFTDLQAKNQSSLTSTQVKKIGSDSSDDKSFNKFEFRVASTYTRTTFCINYYNTSGAIAYDFVINQDVDNQGNKSFYPSVSGTSNLGTSSNKWKTLNGINPGALSLPDSVNAVNIDITNWDKRATNNAIGSITASMDGWINVQIQRDVDFAVWVIGTYRQLFRAGIQSNGKYLVMLMLPVTKNATVTLYTLPLDALESDLVFGVYRFYPCLGNV